MLRHTVLLQAESSTSDGMGGQVKAWTTEATIRAFVKPKSGTERIFATRLDSTLTHDVFMRYRTGVVAPKRLLFKGRPLQIRAVINIEEADRWLQLQCEEGVAT